MKDDCECGATYQTAGGPPDRRIFDLWAEQHLTHMETSQ